MNRVFVVTLVAALISAPAAAEPESDTGSGGGTFWVKGESNSTTTSGETNSTTTTTTDETVYYELPACGLGGTTVCDHPATCSNGELAVTYTLVNSTTNEVVTTGTYCPGEDIEVEEPGITRVMISRAFRRLPMPEATLQIQPPDGRTLVNFETNFFTHDRTLRRTVRLLGQRVDFRIWVDTYRWRYGDGQSEVTASPGAAYPALDITHNYTRTGRYRPSLDATYTADYRIDGSAWQPVDGTVTIAGTPVTLRAIEATPTLVSYAD